MMRRRLRYGLVLVAVCVLATLGAQELLTDTQRIDQAQALLAPLETRVTFQGRMNYRNIRTRLNTLRGQLLEPEPTVVDCELSEFALASAGEWGVCQPDSTQTRTETWARTITTEPANGGAICPMPLTEERTATQACVFVPPPPPPPDPVDCVLSEESVTTGPWGPWQVQPDGTTEVRTRIDTWTRTVLVEPANGGAPCGETSGTRTETETRPFVPPPPPPSVECGQPLMPAAHPYYAGLTLRSDCAAAYSLRSTSQITQYINRSKPPAITYDFANDPDPRKQDAAKVLLPEVNTSLPTQVWLPLNHQPRTPLLATWDTWWGKEFKFAHAGIGVYKAFQFGSPNETIFTEVRARFALSAVSIPEAIALTDIRPYGSHAEGALGPNVVTSPGPQMPLGVHPTLQRNYGTGTLGPMANEFAIAPETWTRYWMLFVPQEDGLWYRMSLWMADETRDPVKVYDGLQMLPRRIVKNSDGVAVRLFDMDATWGTFRLEYNSSTATIPEGRGTLTAYFRNFVTLRTADVTGLLQKPVK